MEIQVALCPEFLVFFKKINRETEEKLKKLRR